MNKVSIVAAALVFSSSTLALAQDDEGPHDKAIKGRQALMQFYSFNLGILGAMAKGEMEYDADLATASAENLDAAANMVQSAMWPQGSDSETAGNAENRALPKIWETYPEVSEKGKALPEATATLATAAGDGLDALKQNIGPVGEACKGCHDDFRAEKDG